MNKEENNKQFEKVDKITRIFTIIICCSLGAVFLAACTYMINLIGEEQNNAQTNTNNSAEVQNMNLVSM